MNLRIKNRNLVPPGSFQWEVPETKVKLAHPYWVNLIRMIRAHYLANDIEVPLDIEDQVDAANCKRLIEMGRKDLCESTITIPRKMITGLEALTRWAMGGFQRVSEEVYHEREKFCIGLNGGDRCAHFNGMQTTKEEMNTSIIHCGKCGCTSLKLALPDSECPLGYWGKESAHGNS